MIAMRAGRSTGEPQGRAGLGINEAPEREGVFQPDGYLLSRGSQPKCCQCRWWGPYCPFWEAEQPPKAPACKCFEPREDEIVSLAWLEEGA